MKLFSRNIAWKRGKNDYAHCFSELNLVNLISKRVTIQQGSKALFLQNGIYSGIYPSGVYTFGDIILQLGLNLRKQTTLIIVDTADIEIPFSVTEQDNLRTKDYIAVSTNGRVLVRLDKASLFYEYYLKSRDSISLPEIVNDIYHDILGGLKEVLSNYSVTELYGNSELYTRIMVNLVDEVNDSIRQKGFEICSIVSIEFNEESWKPVIEKINRSKTEVALAMNEATTNILLREFAAADDLNRIETRDTVDRAARKAKADKESDELHHEISLDRELFEHRMKKLKSIMALREQKQRLDLGDGSCSMYSGNCQMCEKHNVELTTPAQCKQRV